MHQINAQIVIADPASFRREQESLSKRKELAIRLGDLGNLHMPNRYTENILFERDDKPCPVRVFVSTDSFRPVKIKKGEKEDTVETLEGFDPTTLLNNVIYVDGFVAGCNMGHALYIADEVHRLRRKE